MSIIAIVYNLTNLATDGRNVCKRIGSGNHRRLLGEFDSGSKSISVGLEHIISHIYGAIGGKLVEDWHLHLLSIEQTGKNDIGETDLLTILQMIKIDLQATSTLAWSRAGHLVREFTEFLTLF